MNSTLRNFLASTIGKFPVRIRSGMGQGARWTAYPWASYWRGTHEPSVQEAILRVGARGMTGWSCWDLGAHFGLYSVSLARMVGPTGQVAAFEPNPMSFARLCRHQKMNRITWLKLYQAAASDISGKGELLTNGNLDSTSTHLRYDDEVQDGQSNPIGIAVVRIDDLVEKGEMRLPHFIKIDVEGHGHKAVLGMRNSIEKSRPSMIIGFHSRAEVDGILDVLKPMGYRWEAVVAPESNADSLIGGDYLFTAS